MSVRENTVTLTVSELLYIRAALLEGFSDPDLPRARGYRIGDSASFPLPERARDHALSLLGLTEGPAFVLNNDPAWNLDADPAFTSV